MNMESGDTFHRQDRKRPPFVRLLVGLVVVLLVGFGLYQGCSLTAPTATPSPTPEGELGIATSYPTTEGTAAPPSVTATSATASPTPTKAPSDERWAFVLLGYGGGNHEGGYLTDSIMVVIADPSRKTMTLLSIPRDSWVPLLFDGENATYGKVNEAYAQVKETGLHPERLPRYKGDNGAGNFVKDTLSQLLGIPIDNYLALDFAGFREMIDAVGGIEVEVPDSFSALYPANDDPSIDASWMTVTFAKGKEHMDGERAIQFARAREAIDNPSEGTDFARSRRQRIILEAFKSQLFQPGGLIHLPQILAISAQHLDTDYAIQDVGQLGQFIMSWKDVRFYQTALSLSNYLGEDTGPGGAYVLVPGTPANSWGQIRAFARRLWQDPATGVALAGTRITVVNNTAQPGVAEQLSETLARLGYRVTEPLTGSPQADSRLVDRSGGKAALVVEQLRKDLGTDFQQVSEPAQSIDNELVLELGWNDVRLADLVVTEDEAAPSSAVGIQGAGVWLPAVATPESPATETPGQSTESESTPSPLPTETALPEDSTTATGTPESSPTVLPTETVVESATPTSTASPAEQATTVTPTETGAWPLATPTSESTTATPEGQY